MNISTFYISLFALLLFLPAGPVSRTTYAASLPDHLTEQEAGLVADTQELDKRTAVFIKAIERRFLVISNPNATQSNKDKEIWGPLPTGTRAKLVEDISKIIDEAITNIENVNERDPSNPLLAKSLRKLSEACKGFATQFLPMKEKAQDEREFRAIIKALDSAQEVIDAAQKLPPTKGKSN
jgi:hypothetical protein